MTAPVLVIPALAMRIWLAPVVSPKPFNPDPRFKCTIAFGSRVWVKARLIRPVEINPEIGIETKSPVFTLRAELDL